MSAEIGVSHSQKKAVTQFNETLQGEAPIQIHGLDKELAVGYFAILLRKCLSDVQALSGYELRALLGKHNLLVATLPLSDGELVYVPTHGEVSVSKTTTKTRTGGESDTLKKFAAELYKYRKVMDNVRIALINTLTEEEVPLGEE